MADGATLIILVVITLLCKLIFHCLKGIHTDARIHPVPPLGVFFVSGFSVDFLINIVLTILA